MILLDTQCWIWLVESDPALKYRYRQRIQENQLSGLLVSAISCWEIAEKAKSGKLVLPEPPALWIKRALAYPGVRCAEISADIAVRAALLGWEHKDPADRLIVATALSHDCPLLTTDRRILDFPLVKLAVVRSQTDG